MKIALEALLLTATLARGDVTLLLEAPMGSFWSGNPAHMAVYLSRVCAESPVVLRRCAPGEEGAVLSRYHRVDSYDWIAIPLIPYLYSVENAAQAPRSASREEAQGLRETFREAHLAGIAPDPAGPHARSRDWPQLVGEAYDRTLYAFTLATTPQQDDELIRTLNSSPNRNRFNIAFRNCANFAAQIVDFYFPGAVRYSLWTPGIMTPRHVAVALIGYSERHPALKFSAFVIKQVPGSVPRSKPVDGVWSRKYVRTASCGHPDVSVPTLACPGAGS